MGRCYLLNERDAKSDVHNLPSMMMKQGQQTGFVVVILLKIRGPQREEVGSARDSNGGIVGFIDMEDDGASRGQLSVQRDGVVGKESPQFKLIHTQEDEKTADFELVTLLLG